MVRLFRRTGRSGLLWLVASTAMWASRRRSARRAALRGLLDAALAWGVTGLLRRVFDDRTRSDAVATAFAAGAA
ncbi:MAG: phosphoesterase, partial [Actinomycetota bacterium]|nr:phosphoesterase [Actinomycetota bacterium]